MEQQSPSRASMNWPPAFPEDTVSALRKEIRSALRQQLDHSVQRVIHRMGGMVL